MPAQTAIELLQRIVETQAAAWNAGDADAWSACFSDDASFVNIMGMTLGGRAHIAERHGVMFRTVFQGSVCSARVERVVLVAAGVMLASIECSVSGQRRQPPGISATDPDGTLRTRMLYVLTRATPDDAWQVIAAQNTALVPPAAGVAGDSRSARAPHDGGAPSPLT